MKIPEFLGMTLGDLFAALDLCTSRFVEAAKVTPPAWPELYSCGRRACFLSQCIVTNIEEKRRRRDMPCNQARRRLQDFTRAARAALKLPRESADELSYAKLEQFTKNMEARAKDLREMAKQSKDLDRGVFGLSHTKEKKLVPTPQAPGVGL